MKRLFKTVGKAAKGAANKGVETAKNAAKDPRVQTAVTKAVQQVSPEKARELSEKAIGKEKTKKIIKASNDAYTKVDKTLGEGRLDGAQKSARSAFFTALAAPGVGKAALLPATIVGAAAGFATKKDIVAETTKRLSGTGGEDNTETPKEPETPKESKAKTPEPAKQPRQPKPRSTQRKPK